MWEPFVEETGSEVEQDLSPCTKVNLFSVKQIIPELAIEELFCLGLPGTMKPNQTRHRATSA